MTQFVPSHGLACSLSRRTFLAGTAAVLAMPALRRASASEMLDELVLFGPPAGPSITLAAAIASGKIAPLAKTVRLQLWTNPDEMRAGIASGTMPMAVMPAVAAANMYNKGMGIHLLNTMTDGLLYVITLDPALTTVTSLKGKRLAVPFGNSLPNFVLSRIFAQEGINEAADVTTEITGTPIEAVQLLLTGRVDAALVPEPSATAAIMKGKSAGKSVLRTIDFQAEWGKVTGGAPVLPQAGLGITAKFLAKEPELIETLQKVLEETADAVRADPKAAAAATATMLDLPAPVLEAAIPYCKLYTRRAAGNRDALELSFKAMLETSPKGIGDKLPESGFYL